MGKYNLKKEKSLHFGQKSKKSWLDIFMTQSSTVQWKNRDISILLSGLKILRSLSKGEKVADSLLKTFSKCI